MEELKHRKSDIPVLQDVTDQLCEQLKSTLSLSAIYINCSNICKIEKHFGKKVYVDILKKIREILQDLKGKTVRKNDLLVSLEKEGDEFMIFFSKKREDRDFFPSDLEDPCERITDLLNYNVSPITFPYLRGRPKIIVGYAIIIHNPMIREEKLIHKLIDDAKHMSSYREFKERMRNKEKLQELILKQSIRTFFHPIVDLDANSIIGYEALTRGPEGTEYENPYILFDIAEETELLFELDRLCRKKGLENSRGLKPGLKLFLNCLPSAVLDPMFKGDYLKKVLNDLKLSAGNVVLEFTEREAIEQFDLFKESVQYYKDVGFAIAVDDTGAGYSSLETVVELNPQYIKLDLSIVRGIDQNILKQELIKAVVGLSKQMNATVIAEGIETREELNTLKKIGITTGQGFFFAKPSLPFPSLNS